MPIGFQGVPRRYSHASGRWRERLKRELSSAPLHLPTERLPYTALPNVVMATAVFSLVFVALNGVGARHLAPGILVPMSFAASGLLFVVESLLVSRAPVVTAVLVYLHISGAGPVLGSGFWLVASERFDPRTAKRRFGQIAASGTIGGLLLLQSAFQ